MLYFYDILPFLGSNPPSSSISPPFMGIALPTGCSAICVKWSPKTNQIFCSTSNGKTRVFFDPRLSTKGAIITAGKAPKREKDPSDYALGEGAVFAPEALPMYKQEDPKKKKIKNADLRRDPIRSKIPERPAQKNAENTSFFFTKYIMEGRKNDLSHREDPREALLKMNEIASKDPIFFGAAYSQTQPKVLLHDESFEAEQERSKKRLRTGEE